MELEKIRQAVHQLADAVIDALIATEEDITATEPARSASSPESAAPVQQQQQQETAETAAFAPGVMDFSVFNTELRNLSVQMGPGKLGPAIQPLLAKYAPEGGGIGGVPEQQREAFLNEARAFVQGAAR